MHLKDLLGSFVRVGISYHGPGFLSSVTWPSLPKKHYNGLNQIIIYFQLSFKMFGMRCSRLTDWRFLHRNTLLKPLTRCQLHLCQLNHSYAYLFERTRHVPTSHLIRPQRSGFTLPLMLCRRPLTTIDSYSLMNHINRSYVDTKRLYSTDLLLSDKAVYLQPNEPSSDPHDREIIDKVRNQEDVISDIVSKLRSNLPEKDESLLRLYISPLLSLTCKPQDILLLLSTRPDLLNIPTDKWNKGLRFLTDCGFHKEYLLMVVSSYRNVFSAEGSKVVTASIESLRNLGFRERAIQKLLANNPEIFTIPKRELRVRIDDLQMLFKTIDVIRLVLRSPNVLTDSWKDIEDKYFYVGEQMGIGTKEMMKSSVFQHSLTHIRNRHLFLERAGLYEKPDKHGATLNVNPSLRHIVDTADNVFAMIHAKMDTEDYHIFAKMMEVEDQQNLNQGQLDFENEY